MSAEAPQQIDLNQDLQIQGIHLSADQQENYESFLNKLEEQEKQDIIYLTQQELGEFKRLLDGDDSAYKNADFDEYIDHQRAEGLSMSDMIDNSDSIPDIFREQIENNIDTGEEISREVLFGAEGIFSNIEISETAKDIMSVSMSTSLLSYGLGEIQTKIESGTFTENDMQEIMAMGEDFEEKFAEIKSVLDQTQTSDSGSNPYESVVRIAQQGELNSIFMNPAQGVEFFSNILTGEISATNIEQVLEEANKESSDLIETDISTAGNILQTSLRDVSEALRNHDIDGLRDIVTTAGGSQESGFETKTGELTGNNETDAQGTKKNFFERIMELIKDMLSGLIKIDTNSGDNDSSPLAPVMPEETQNPLSQLKDSLLTQLGGGAFTGMQESSLREYFSDLASVGKISEIMKQIPTLGEQDTDIEKLENLFFTPIKSNENIMKIDAFVAAGGLESYKNADNSLDNENLLGIMRAYSNYRIAHSEDTSLSYEAYFTNMSE